MRTPTSDQLNPPYIQHKCRRDYQRWFKLQIVRECMVPGASVSLVGRKHNINTNVIFRWRAEYERGELAPGTPQVVVDSFIPVGVIGKDGRLVKEVAPPQQLVTAVPATVTAKPAQPTGVIELELSARIKVRCETGVDKETLRRVLAVAREFA